MDMHNRIRSNKSAHPVEPVRRPVTRAVAENQLRDIAYVLHLTRRLRNEILSEREAKAHDVCHA